MQITSVDGRRCTLGTVIGTRGRCFDEHPRYNQRRERKRMKRGESLYIYRDITLSTVSLAIFLSLPILCHLSTIPFLLIFFSLYLSLFVFLSLAFCPLLTLTLVNRNHRCVRFLPQEISALTMKNEEYCLRHMHAPFALSMPSFIPFIIVVRHEYPYANTRNSTRGSSTARESSIYLSPIIIFLLFISIYALAPINRLRDMLPDLFLFLSVSFFFPLFFQPLLFYL